MAKAGVSFAAATLGGPARSAGGVEGRDEELSTLVAGTGICPDAARRRRLRGADTVAHADDRSSDQRGRSSAGGRGLRRHGGQHRAGLRYRCLHDAGGIHHESHRRAYLCDPSSVSERSHRQGRLPLVHRRWRHPRPAAVCDVNPVGQRLPLHPLLRPGSCRPACRPAPAGSRWPAWRCACPAGQGRRARGARPGQTGSSHRRSGSSAGRAEGFTGVDRRRDRRRCDLPGPGIGHRQDGQHHAARQDPGRHVVGGVQGGKKVWDALEANGQVADALQRINAARDCAVNPTNPLTRQQYQDNPAARDAVVKQIDDSHDEVTQDAAVLFVQLFTDAGAGLVKAAPWLGFITSPATNYIKENLGSSISGRVRAAQQLVPACRKISYRVTGGGGGVTVNATSGSVKAPFTVNGAGNGFVVTFSMTPGDATGTFGNITYEGSGSGVTMSGTGEYTISGKDPGPYQLQMTVSGCVDGGQCSTNTDTWKLTPQTTP